MEALKSLLANIKATDIARIELDLVEDTIEVEYNLTEGDETVSNVDTFEFPDSIPAGFSASATELVQQAVAAVRARGFKTIVPCETCTGGCCHGGIVRVTAKDVEELGAHFGEKWLESYIVKYSDPSFAGHVGLLARCDVAANGVNVEEETDGCVFLRKDGCSIYENRPEICREYSCWGCEEYNEDPKKKARVDAGKRTLRVVS